MRGFSGILIGSLLVMVVWYIYLDGFQVNIDNVDILRKYSPDELLYFKDIAFGYPNKIKRWNQPITVAIKGSPSREDCTEVKKVVAEMTKILGSGKINFTKHEGNLRVHFFSSSEEFEAQKPTNLHDVRGYTQPKFTFSNEINQIDIYINPFIKGSERYRTLRHEFCHAMGLWNHSKRQYADGRLLGVWLITLDNYEFNESIPASITPADARAIQLLYEDYMPIGLTQSSFESHLREIGVNP